MARQYRNLATSMDMISHSICKFLIEWSGVSTRLTYPPGQNGRHVADDIFRCIFMYEKFIILIGVSLKIVPNGQIDII